MNTELNPEIKFQGKKTSTIAVAVLILAEYLVNIPRVAAYAALLLSSSVAGLLIWRLVFFVVIARIR